MRRLILLLLLFLLNNYYVQSQMIPPKDTLRLNYFHSTTEFGGINVGIMIYSKDSSIVAKRVYYNNISTGCGHIEDKIYDFYNKNKDNYMVIGEEITLSQKQIEYLNGFLEGILNKINNENKNNVDDEYIIVSNCSGDHYVIMCDDKSYIYFEKESHQHLDLEEVLGERQWYSGFIIKNKIIFPLSTDTYIFYERKKYSIIHPLLVLNDIIIRDDKMIDAIRRRYSQLIKRNIKYMSKSEAEKIGIREVPDDGVVFARTEKDFYLDVDEILNIPNTIHKQ